MERYTVEYTFDGEKLSFVVNEYADLTLYRTDEGGTSSTSMRVSLEITRYSRSGSIRADSPSTISGSCGLSC